MDKLALHTLLFRITQLQKAHLRPRMRSCDLTQGQPKVLHYLAKHAPCRGSEKKKESRCLRKSVDRIRADAAFAFCTGKLLQRTDSEELRMGVCWSFCGLRDLWHRHQKT